MNRLLKKSFMCCAMVRDGGLSLSSGRAMRGPGGASSP